jgi:hypothetical protein
VVCIYLVNDGESWRLRAAEQTRCVMDLCRWGLSLAPLGVDDRSGKGYTDLFPEDGLPVDGSNDF